MRPLNAALVVYFEEARSFAFSSLPALLKPNRSELSISGLSIKHCSVASRFNVALEFNRFCLVWSASVRFGYLRYELRVVTEERKFCASLPRDTISLLI